MTQSKTQTDEKQERVIAHIKGYLHSKTVTSQNVPIIFLLHGKVMFLFQDISF